MNLIEFSVRRFQFTLVMFGLLIAIGISALESIPRAEDPSFPIPIVIVTAVYPGADPQDIERLVAKPLEDVLNETTDIKEIRSTSSDGLAVVTVEYDWSKDAEKKFDEALREINAVRGKLPQGLAELSVTKASPGLVTIIQIAVVGPTSTPRELRDTADDLKEQIERAYGVRNVEISGLPKAQIRIDIDLSKLASYKIPLTQVIDVLKGENTLIPGGSVVSGTRRYNVQTSGNYRSLEEISNTIVAVDRGKLIRLSSVANVGWNYEEANYLTRFNGQRAVFVSITQKDDMNIFKVRDAVVGKVDEFRKSMSPNMRIEIGFDQSENVHARLRSLGIDFAIAVCLVLITLLPLGLRAATVVMISIPMSMAIGVALLYVTGFSLNQLSIAGFVLALGLLVDDSIVVTENIERFLRSGYSRVEAAIAATKQIYFAVLGCTATLMFAFFPLFMLPEGAGKFVKSLAASVSFTIVASLFVALTMIPFLSSRVLREHNGEGSQLLKLIMRGIHTIYRPLLHWTLGFPKTSVTAAALLFFAAIGLIPLLGVSLFPTADIPQFMISVETPEGSSVEATDKAVRFVEARLLANPEVRTVFSNSGRGNPRTYNNVFRRETRANVGDLFVVAQHYSPTRTPLFLDELRHEFADYPEAHIMVQPFESGPPLAAPIAIRVVGPDLDTLSALAAQVESAMSATAGTRDTSNPLRLNRTDIDLGIDVTKASLFGVPTINIDRTVRLSIAGEEIGNFREADGDEIPIVVRAPYTTGHPEPELFNQIYVNNLQGDAIPLRQMIDPKFVSAPTSISRFDRQRSVTVTSHVTSGFNTEQVTDELVKKLASIEWPPGYQFIVAGAREQREKSVAGLQTAAVIALFGILAILVLEFGDFRSTIIVAGVIPLGIIGGMFALFLSGYSLSFMAMIGFIALIGIEIKNSILLVDFTHQLRETGIPLRQAIEQAGEIRFLPILLTSLTAIGGLLPLALQKSPLYSPLAWVVIGGLVSSTLLSRLVTPAMYFLLAPSMEGAKHQKVIETS